MIENLRALPPQFFAPSAREVAPALLGHYLLRRTPEGCSGGIIVETEAYLRDDPACHAARGKTRRNQTMFGPPGRAYVYFIYGCHTCVNAVCCPEHIGEAVLIRAIEPTIGQELMERRRALHGAHLTSGPGKLTQALDLGLDLDGTDLCDPESPLLIARNPEKARFVRTRGPLVTTTRIGITKAAALPLRFYLAGSVYVSRPRSPQ